MALSLVLNEQDIVLTVNLYHNLKKFKSYFLMNNNNNTRNIKCKQVKCMLKCWKVCLSHYDSGK